VAVAVLTKGKVLTKEKVLMLLLRRRRTLLGARALHTWRSAVQRAFVLGTTLAAMQILACLKATGRSNSALLLARARLASRSPSAARSKKAGEAVRAATPILLQPVRKAFAAGQAAAYRKRTRHGWTAA